MTRALCNRHFMLPRVVGQTICIPGKGDPSKGVRHHWCLAGDSYVLVVSTLPLLARSLHKQTSQAASVRLCSPE